MFITQKEFNELCKKMGLDPKKQIKKHKTTKDFDSLAESNFFKLFISKKIKSGEIIEYKLHQEFTIVDAVPEYKLHSKKFKPDFYIKFKNNAEFIVEMKGSVVKKLQRDYGLRKHLFIQKFCIPNNWKFVELKSELWTQDPLTALQEFTDLLTSYNSEK